MEAENKTENQPEISAGESLEKAPPLGDQPAAFTLVIQSWATPIVGIIMLVAGFLGGYFGRPLFSSEGPAVAVGGESSPVDTVQATTMSPTPDATRAAQQQALMTAVIEHTRHFLGDPNAPVTIIEFSDFQ